MKTVEKFGILTILSIAFGLLLIDKPVEVGIISLVVFFIGSLLFMYPDLKSK